MGLAMMEGGRKFGSHNYRAVGTRASVYYDAIMRHVTAWWEGEGIDPDSGVHHLIKAAACILVIRDSQLMGNDVDDRPIKYPDGLNIPKFNKQAEDIIEKYSDCVAPYLEKDKKFVCPTGWRIELVDGWCSNCGWCVETNMNEYLHKDNRLHAHTTGWNNHRFGEAPGYWPTKEAAEDTLRQYLEKEQCGKTG